MKVRNEDSEPDVVCVDDHQSEDVFVSALVRTAQPSHRAKEWLSVVSELTQRLNKGTKPACSSFESSSVVAEVRRQLFI